MSKLATGFTLISKECLDTFLTYYNVPNKESLCGMTFHKDTFIKYEDPTAIMLSGFPISMETDKYLPLIAISSFCVNTVYNCNDENFFKGFYKIGVIFPQESHTYRVIPDKVSIVTDITIVYIDEFEVKSEDVIASANLIKENFDDMSNKLSFGYEYLEDTLANLGLLAIGTIYGYSKLKPIFENFGNVFIMLRFRKLAITTICTSKNYGASKALAYATQISIFNAIGLRGVINSGKFDRFTVWFLAKLKASRDEMTDDELDAIFSQSQNIFKALRMVAHLW